jgi:hypothetical protein
MSKSESRLLFQGSTLAVDGRTSLQLADVGGPSKNSVNLVDSVWKLNNAITYGTQHIVVTEHLDLTTLKSLYDDRPGAAAAVWTVLGDIPDSVWSVTVRTHIQLVWSLMVSVLIDHKRLLHRADP